MPDLNFQPGTDFTIQIAEFELEFDNVFHMKNLYKLVHEWLKDEGFSSTDTHDEKYENLYFHKVLADGSVEHHIWWRGYHIPDGSSYIKYFIRFDFQTLYMSDKKIDVGGKKVSTNSGDVIMRCNTFLMLDYDRKWRDHKYLKLIHRWFINRIYRDTIDNHKTRLWNLTYKLQSSIKQYLKMKNPGDGQRSFNPDLGV
ncbi:MAG: hypothetical protein ACMXX6_00095 [Candidatus Woesearchaeota archaeon]